MDGTQGRFAQGFVGNRGESWTEQGTHEELLQDLGHWHADVGDSAHPTLPFLAQGANMAIENATVMARCLSAQDTAEKAFAQFEQLR